MKAPPSIQKPTLEPTVWLSTIPKPALIYTRYAVPKGIGILTIFKITKFIIKVL